MALRSRRDFLRVTVGIPAGLLLSAGGGAAAQAPVRPTPACPDPPGPTPRQTAGPFFRPSSPRRTSFLEPGVSGTRIVVAGAVLFTDCQPVPRALVDVWHADEAGHYDNAGDKLRGHQFTDDHGRYRLQTIMPGFYAGRTRHVHVKVQAPGQPGLTTQLYFPDEPGNRADSLFNPDLVMQVRDGEEGKLASFDFILRKDRT
jgi:protocatechuate 3,4-dioxygenase beta subunit